MQIEGGETAPQTLTHPFKAISPSPHPPLPPHPHLKGLAPGPELISCTSGLLLPAFSLPPPLLRLSENLVNSSPSPANSPQHLRVLSEPLFGPRSRRRRYAVGLGARRAPTHAMLVARAPGPTHWGLPFLPKWKTP
jgi:hypothetical protein